MFRWARRSCLGTAVGCLLPPILVLGVLAFLAHQILTPPDFPPSQPASAAAIQLAAGQAVQSALSNQNSVALVHLDSSEATYLLRQSLPGYAGLSDLAVHLIDGEVLVSGQTAILGHPLVVSGPVRLQAADGSVVDLTFKGLSIGQLGLPTAIPQLLTHGLHPQFDLSLVADGRTLSFACSAVRGTELVVGFYYGSTQPANGSAACTAPS